MTRDSYKLWPSIKLVLTFGDLTDAFRAATLAVGSAEVQCCRHDEWINEYRMILPSDESGIPGILEEVRAALNERYRR